MAQMEASRIVAAGAAIVLVVGYALGASLWVSTGREFYLSLDRPPWQPPDVVFGLIWPYNFLVLGLAGVMVALAGTGAARMWWLGLTFLSVAAALGWAWLFYIGQALWPAALALTLATLLTIPIVVLTWQTSRWSGVLLVPYLLWLAVASSLAVGFAVRNPT